MNQKLLSLQTEALQRIHVFRLFDVFSLLDCLYSLRGGILQQVRLQFFSFGLLLYLGSLSERAGSNFQQQSDFVTFGIRRLLAAAALSRR